MTKICEKYYTQFFLMKLGTLIETYTDVLFKISFLFREWKEAQECHSRVYTVKITYLDHTL
jgi:hypothetical protein